MRITNIEGIYVFKADLCIMKRFTVIRESFSQITRKVFFFNTNDPFQRCRLSSLLPQHSRVIAFMLITRGR